LLNDLLLGVVATPGSGTFVCTAWEHPDDYFNKWTEVFCYSGIGIGTTGNPTDWVNSTHTLTFLPAATLTTADLVELHRTWVTVEYNDAINLAIEDVVDDALTMEVDITLSLTASTYQYTIPAAFVYIHKLEMESSTSGLFNEQDAIDNQYWRIVPGVTNKIEFISDMWAPTAGRKLRISGLQKSSTLATDAATTGISPNYLAYQAAAYLHASRIRGTSSDVEDHKSQFAFWQSKADMAKARIRTALPPGSRKVYV
jgi:hypothetical protein